MRGQPPKCGHSEPKAPTMRGSFQETVPKGRRAFQIKGEPRQAGQGLNMIYRSVSVGMLKSLMGRSTLLGFLESCDKT